MYSNYYYQANCIVLSRWDASILYALSGDDLEIYYGPNNDNTEIISGWAIKSKTMKIWDNPLGHTVTLSDAETIKNLIFEDNPDNHEYPLDDDDGGGWLLHVELF